MRFLFFVFYIFSISAWGFTWTGSNVSGTNSDLTCQGTECELISQGLSSDSLIISGVGELDTHFNLLIDGTFRMTPLANTGMIAFSSGSYLDMTNEGTIQSFGATTATVMMNVNSFVFGDIINNGEMFAQNRMLWLDDDSTFNGTFYNHGLFAAQGYGIYFDTDSTWRGDFYNTGEASSTDDFITMLANTTFEGNFYNTGYIYSGDYALMMNDSLWEGNWVNYGEIESEDYLLNLTNNSLFRGDFVNLGDIQSNTAFVVINNAELYGDIGNGGTLQVNTDFVNLATALVSDDIINTGTIFASDDGIETLNSQIGDNIINYGRINAQDYFANIVTSSVMGSFYNAGEIFSQDRGLYLDRSSLYEDILNDTHATLRSQAEAIYIEHSFVFGDIHNAGLIEGGFVTDGTPQPETFGILLINTDFDGTITNEATGIIKGQFGITQNQDDYNVVSPTTVNAKELRIHNDGLIQGTHYEGIAFDVTADYGIAHHYDNILYYSGRGEVVGGNGVDIDMGSGTDQIFFSNLYSDWFTITGAEEIQVSNSTLLLDLTVANIGGALIDESATTDMTIENTNFILQADATLLANGTDIILLESQNLNDAEIANLALTFNGWTNVQGTFEVDDASGNDQLIFHLNSAPVRGLFVDQAVSATPAEAMPSVLTGLMNGMVQSSNEVILNHGNKKVIETAAATTDVPTAIEKDQARSVWTQVFGQKATYEGQTDASGAILSAGYDSDFKGLVLGFDQSQSKNTLTGLALTYGTGSVEGVFNQFDADLTHYQVSAYWHHLKDNVFSHISAGMGRTTVDQNRWVLSNAMSSDYEINNTSLQGGVGYVWKMTEKAVISPSLKGQFVHAKQSDYLESNGAIAQRVSALTTDSMQGFVGLEASYEFDYGSSVIHPRLVLDYGKEFADDGVSLVNTTVQTGLTGANSQTPSLGETIVKYGAGVQVKTDWNSLLSVDYQQENRQRYQSETLVLSARFLF